MRTFYATGESHLHTAEQLNLHRNTVKYRVDKALASTRSHDRLDIALALQVCEFLGPAVLRPRPNRGERPACFSAIRRANSSCPLTLRRSSAAQVATAAYTSGSKRSSTFLGSRLTVLPGTGIRRRRGNHQSRAIPR